MAYIPVRDAFRAELMASGMFSSAMFTKETKEDHPEIDERHRKQPTQRSGSSASYLIAQYESDVRASIHSTMHNGGLKAVKKTFKWVLMEGIWVKNPLHDEAEPSL